MNGLDALVGHGGHHHHHRGGGWGGPWPFAYPVPVAVPAYEIDDLVVDDIVRGVDASADTVLSAEVKFAVAATEATFEQLKTTAAAKGWPVDLTPEIVAVDKEWQALKKYAATDQVLVAKIRERMIALIRRLNPPFYMREVPGIGRPAWQVAAAGAGAIAFVGIVTAIIRRAVR